MLQGYIAGLVITEGLKKTTINTGESLTASLERLESYELGGLTVRFSKDHRDGLKYSELAFLSKDGKLRY
jgi:branched-chain amino acid transport system substrate-binding protein